MARGGVYLCRVMADAAAQRGWITPKLHETGMKALRISL